MDELRTSPRPYMALHFRLPDPIVSGVAAGTSISRGNVDEKDSIAFGMMEDIFVGNMG